MKKRVKTYTISAVAEMFDIHPQTLRLYEREGLLKPSRSDGNTRLYSDEDIERLEVILSLTRDLGVNLAGVEIIINMREKMDAMQREFERFFDYRNHRGIAAGVAAYRTGIINGDIAADGAKAGLFFQRFQRIG